MSAASAITEIALGFLESVDVKEHFRVNGKKYYADGNLPFETAMAIITSSRHSLEKKISAIKTISSMIGSLNDDKLDEEADRLDGIVKAGEFALSETIQNIHLKPENILASPPYV